jgi:hypothetical protein
MHESDEKYQNPQFRVTIVFGHFLAKANKWYQETFQ